MARLVLPGAERRKLRLIPLLGVAAVLTSCGGGSSGGAPAPKRIGGSGYSFQAPQGWKVRRTFRSVEAESGGALVSVTVFRLAKRYRPELWDSVVPELDRVAGQLAAREQGKLERTRTETIAGRKSRVYEIARSGAQERIAFLLEAKREYQLFCKGAGAACDTLLSSFRIG